VTEDSAIRRYQQTDVHSVSPEKLLVMLYDGLIRYLRLAGSAIARGDRVAMVQQIDNAQSIVLLLRRALDHEAGGQIAANLESLYDFVFAENLQALADSDPRHLAHSVRILEPLRDAWQRIAASAAAQARREPGAEATVNPTAAPAAAGPLPASGPRPAERRPQPIGVENQRPAPASRANICVTV
jgi:flagellar protein FliS